jgi:hypothetical protein
MSISITVGSKTHTIEGEGAIDTKEEAEAALTFVPDGSTETVTAGKDSYTRDQLIAIRDAEEGGTKRGEGASHGVAVEGNGYGGLGDPNDVNDEGEPGAPGHDGGGVSARYVVGIPLGDSGLYLDPTLGFRVNHGTMTFQTPGGEEGNSSFTSFGATGGADLRLALPVLNPFWAAVGLRFSVGGFTTPEGGTVSTPASCVPDEFGRADCEPGAGPRTGNAGTKGVYNMRVGNSREASGVALDFDIPVTVGVDVLQDEWGSLGIFGQFIPGITGLLPSDGDGFSFWRLGGGGGLVARFGGSAAEVPAAAKSEDKDGDGVTNDKDECPGTLAGQEVDAKGCPIEEEDEDGDGVADSEDKCPKVAGTKESGGCPDFAASITSIPESVKPEGKLPIGVNVSADSELSVEFKDAAGKVTNTKPASVKAGESVSEFDVPASLASGKYKVVVTMTDPKTGVKKTEEKEIVIVERVTATLPGSFAPGQPPAVQDIKVVGQPKLEGVSYVIQAKDRKTNEVTESAVAEKPGTIQSGSGTKLSLQAPGGKGFKKETDYTVILKNKDGHVVWTGSFEIGEAPPPPPAPKGGGAPRRRL